MISVASRWDVRAPADAAVAAELAEALRLPPTLARLLVQRGVATKAAAKHFLRPTLAALSDPLELKDMAEAVAIVARAIRDGRTIFVHGDYDVDGQCAAALLTRVIRLAGGTVVPFVPHRLRDGYDFGPAGLAAALACEASVVLTCDCGVTATETIARAKEAGLQVVVTDHHLTHTVPPADAVVNPRRSDCPSTSKELCGAGVAFKLTQALVRELGMGEHVPFHFLDLVALATVADIVPLTGENRVLVRFGLKMLQASPHVGLRALINVVGLGGKPIRAGQVGFVLAPRLNAAGRIGDAMDGLRLLLTDDEGEAIRCARELDTINARRQEIDVRILDEALEDVERDVVLDREFGLVLAREGWHPGVIGIVASRIVERFGRPTVLVALDGEEGRGSGRSIPEFDLHAALSQCDAQLERWGGHRQAAGLTVRRDRLEAFRSRFNEVASAELTAEDVIPRQRVDIVVPVQELSDELEQLLRHLEPCGPGNPAPVLGVRGAYARTPQVVGSNHLKFTLDDGTGRLPAIGFNLADRVDEGWASGPVDVAVRLERNEWRGSSTLQARVVQVTPTG